MRARASPSSSARASPSTSEREGRSSTRRGDGRSTRRPPRARAGPNEANDGTDDEDDANPARVLGLVDVDARALTMKDVRRAYRAAAKRAHPDRGGTVKAATRARDAYEALARAVETKDVETLRSMTAMDDGDPFSSSTIRATFDGARSVFVDETRCVGEEACARSCAARAPRSFERARDTGAARATMRAGTFEDGSPEAYAEWMAAGQCPRECVWFVTEAQRAFLANALKNARDGGARDDEVGALISELLAKAEYNNGREAGRRATESARERT